LGLKLYERQGVAASSACTLDGKSRQSVSMQTIFVKSTRREFEIVYQSVMFGVQKHLGRNSTT